MPECVRYDEIAGITLQVESDVYRKPHAYLEAGAMDSWVGYFCDVAHARAAVLRAPDPRPPAAPRQSR